MKITSYDETSDILCIYAGWRRDKKFSVDDEEADKIFVLRDSRTNEIVGAKIIDCKKVK